MSGVAGRSGRRPQPTAITLLKGDVRPSRMPTNEPKPKVRLPPAPAHLSDVAKAEWKKTGKRLVALGVMTETDTSALAAYCTAYARWVEAEQMLNERGVLWQTTNDDGIELFNQSPYLSIANKALEQMQKLLIEFGMTPSSRTRVRAVKVDEEDPFESYLSGRAN
jgi:P27 family predicted phage terminase small subunit